ncbi:MAG: IS6 family transposase [Hydrococcus sp. RM1_1_31]|nr:IS6 family transposase [Hydrococcus sp. RM1_1_31]
MNQKKPFKWKHFQGDIILLCVRWYLRYSLSYRNLEEMMLERGLSVDHCTIYRWVQIFAPELEKRSRSYLKLTNDSWRVDETYIKVKGDWKYLYRAVDSKGHTLEFMLSATRDALAAARFLKKALKARHNQQPRVINVDKNAAYPLAVEALKQENILNKETKLRQVKYLNNRIEQDHRFIKRLVRPGLGFQSFHTAWRTIRGYEILNGIRKGQVNSIEKGDILGQNQFINSLFGIAV